MTTINCDRCKKQITHYVDMKVLYGDNTIGETPKYINFHYQLCEDCLTEVEKFINLG